MTEQGPTEEHTVESADLVSRVKQLVHEGNVRRIVVKNEKGETVIEIPLTFGVVGAALFPMWLALGSFAGLAARYTLVVERRGD